MAAAIGGAGFRALSAAGAPWQSLGPRVTNDYMSDYKSRVLSLRIEEALLESVREQARADGRSVSGQIVYFVRERVASAEEPKPVRKITGWLAHRAVPESLAEFQSARAEASATLRAAVRRKARAK